MSIAKLPFSRPVAGAAGLLAAVVLLLAFAAAASAANFQRPFEGVVGSVEEATLGWPALLAVDPSNGDILVGDNGNSAEQLVEVSATEGTFKLSFEGKTTASISYDASAATVQEAVGLAFNGSASNREIYVSSSSPSGSQPYTFNFGGKYTEQPVEQLVCEDGSPPLSGGSGCSVTVSKYGVEQGLYRYGPDGAPAAFTALGGNVIDGKRGPDGKACAQEPASCDETPQNGLELSSFATTQQMAIGPNGNIYFTEGGLFGQTHELVYVFSAEGKYLGELNSSKIGRMEKPCGVAVDSAGSIYVAGEFGDGTRGVAKYVPQSNVPTNADNVEVFTFDAVQKGQFKNQGTYCNMALGAGPTAESIFLAGRNGNDGVLVMNKEDGVQHQFAEGPTGELGQGAKGYGQLLTVDPTTGNPIIQQQEKSGRELVEFDGSEETAGAPLSRMVDELEGSSSGFGDFVANSDGDVYVVTGPQNPHIFVYGAPAVVPSVTAEPASEVTGTKATLSGTVNPEGTEVSECLFEYGLSTNYGSTEDCGSLPPKDSEAHPVQVHLSGLLPNGKTYHFRLVARGENGREASPDRTFSTAYKAVTDPAEATGTETALLKGTLRPEGEAFTDCSFEYGIATNPGYEHTAECDPVAGDVAADFEPHAVSAAIQGLEVGTTYRFRILAGNPGESLEGEELTFETFGSPRITELGSRDANQDSATIEAKVNPRGFETSYRFEWGPTTGYGHRSPAVPASIGDGQEPVRVSAALSGLSAGTTYHFRVVATSQGGGTITSPDQAVETFDSCGLPEARCDELVSPHDVGPVANPGITKTTNEVQFQADPSPGAVAYIVETGLPDSTKSTEVLYRGTRGSNGWSATQLSAPGTARNERTDVNAISSKLQALSGDLSCAAVESWQPLTDDPAMRLVYEDGGANLYRRNPDGSFTGVTDLAPEDPTADNVYSVVGLAQDCSKIVFSGRFTYPGIPGEGLTRFYEWEEGELRNLGWVPGQNGEAVTDVSVGGGLNAVSEDGSRVFFEAERQTSPNSAEIGDEGLFVRESGTSTRDISLSETSTPDTGASFEWATANGERVLFTANAGIASNGASSGGADLYEYDFGKPQGERLTDLSIDPEPSGAKVEGVLGASRDGSHVYFIARGQLLPGLGNKPAQNESGGSYNVYGVEHGAVSFVGTVGTNQPPAQASADGRYLLFESTADLTGYRTGGAPEAYLYDSQGGSEGTACVSCRPDGQLPLKAQGFQALADAGQTADDLHPPQILSGTAGAPRAVFSSLDVLAPGAVAGQTNLYLWSHGQVSLLAHEAAGSELRVFFAGASEDATDLYFTTPQKLNWEDGDERNSIYDARIGGGFPEPPPAATPCDPQSEGSCQSFSQAGAVPNAASTTFSGPGNAKPETPKPHHKKHKKKKKHKKRHHKKHGHKKHHRKAKSDRRAGK